METKEIHLFDFDGTITRKDSFVAFMRFFAGKRVFYRTMLRFSPRLIAMKLHLADNSRTKELITTALIQGCDQTLFMERCNRFAEQFQQFLRPKAMALLNQLRNDDHARVMIVTASPEEWVRPILPGLEVIGTRLESKNGVMTGRFATPNCHGAEKVNRLKAIITNRESVRLIAYGDSQGDKDMFAYADERHFQPFL